MPPTGAADGGAPAGVEGEAPDVRGPLRDKVHVVRTRTGGERRTSLHPVVTPDGVPVSLSRLARPEATDAVLLIHGLTTSSDMFFMPEHEGLGAYLWDHGFDVWAADFRMSNHYAYNIDRTYTFDDVAVNDWPALVGAIRDAVGPRVRLHVICHCLGSVTFHQALYGPTLPPGAVTSVIANSVSLNPRVHGWALAKIVVAPFLVESVLRLPYLDPRWSNGGDPRMPWLGRALTKLVGAVHLECNDDTCNLLSFMWGSGLPALFVHDKMSPVTHARLADLFGPVAMDYFRNVRAGLLAGNTFGRYSRKPEHAHLPDRYLDNVGSVRVPTLLLSGTENHIFPGANRLTHELIAKKGIEGYEYRELPGYGHQDVFMGKDCAEETFPTMLAFLDRVIGGAAA
jgi:cholesterol oxidase